MARLNVLRQLESGGEASETMSDGMRVVFWNAERCKHLDASIDLAKSANADAILLAEMDYGMARSGQWNTTKEMARHLSARYVFAIEFLELGLGDERESKEHHGQTNRNGLHGNAILTGSEFHDPVLIRFPALDAWYVKSFGQRRIGGRIAIGVKVALGSEDVALVCVHLESIGDPETRAEQGRILLAAIEEYASGLPVLIGGDFNTDSGDSRRPGRKAWKKATHELQPARFANPVPYEPLFPVLADHGFEWDACNVPGHTERTRADGTPEPPLAKLDWFFARDLTTSSPRIIPAVAADGDAISDHEMIAVDISPRR